MTFKITGGCLCGQITYIITQPPVVVARCHCNECRRLSGTGHSVGAMFKVCDVALCGDVHTFQYHSNLGSTVTKASCPNCASPIYGRNSRTPDHLTLALGTMDDPIDLQIGVVIFERDRPHWDCLGENTVIFESQPDWTPET
jgi:hypothetical protein